MKRSNMLKLIEQYLDIYSVNELSPIADDILELIEEAGMVPPIIEEKSFYLAENGEEIYATHEWESEDA